MEQSVFRQLQLTELQILKFFSDLCKKNGLKYSLYAGTLIGAVRHQGFIPWDDDIDVCMPREDYNKLLHTWDDLAHEGFVLVNYDRCPEYTQSFTKIYKEKTTLLYSQEPVAGTPNGINIDIFPVDRIPDGSFKRRVFKIKCMFYHLLLRKYIPENSSRFVQWVCKLILAVRNPSKDDQRINSLLDSITQSNKDSKNSLILIENMRSLKRIYPNDLFENLIELQFEGNQFLCFENWDDKLRIDFGDYMTLPPEEERHPPHHAVLIDFERDYQEIQNGN